jgi:ribonuclease T2
MKMILSVVLASLCVCSGVQAKSKHGGHHPPTNQAGKFDYYVMSLSWSPTFCETHQTNPQCDKHLGFVLHGLWPQYQAGGYPQHCATSEQLTDDARNLGLNVFPTEQLMVHEWQTHGTCSGASAVDYFKAAQSAHESIKVPSQLEPGTHKKNMTGQQISKLVRDANPGVTAKSIALICASKELAEVRICLSKELAPRPCGSKVSSSCGTAAVKVPGLQ